MTEPDFNLLVTLDVLLAENNVTRASKRLRLSASAMSRALARLRETTGDPLLVRAGRGLVPTPRARELRERVSHLVQEARTVLRPQDKLNLRELERTFSIRVREGFAENFGAQLIARLQQDAPRARLCFYLKLDRDSASLRDGTIDLETGVVGEATSPELRAQALFRDQFVGVVREGHPLSEGKMTRSRYAKAKHIVVSRRGTEKGPIDDALEALGSKREMTTIVGSFSAALALARTCDLVATVPERYTGNLRAGMHTFPLPFSAPGITMSIIWHPRMDADPAHRWLRECVRQVCADQLAS